MKTPEIAMLLGFSFPLSPMADPWKIIPQTASENLGDKHSNSPVWWEKS